jgi:spore coat protein U-like protein
MHVALRLLPLALAVATTTPAAANPTANLCRVEATQMIFGNYQGRSSAPQDITATVTVACTALGPKASQVSFTVTPLDGSASNRGMRNGTNNMRYQLFVDAARTRPWGDGTGGSSPLEGSGTVAPEVPLRVSFTLYGRVLARQKMQAGSYVDTIPLRLQW